MDNKKPQRVQRFFYLSSIFLIFFIFFWKIFARKCHESQGQEYFYYYGKKVPVEASDNQIIVKFKDNITEQQRDAVFESEPVLKQSTKLKSWGRNFHKLQLQQTDSVDQIVKRLKLREDVEIANRVYVNASNGSEGHYYAKRIFVTFW